MSRPIFDVVSIYTGADNLASYSFDFKITDLSQILIIETNTLGVVTQRVRGDDVVYLASVDFDSEEGGGTVNLAANLANNYTLFIFLADDEPTQEAEFRGRSTFTLRQFENAIDRIAGQTQRLAWLAGRTLRLHDTYQDADPLVPFDPQIPADIEPGSTIVINPDGNGFAQGPSQEELLQAAFDAAGVAAALADAEAAVVLAEAARDAAIAAKVAALAAQAAAESVAASFTGFLLSGPFTVNNNTNQNLAGELYASATYRQVDFIARVVRGTTVYARCEFSIFYRNGAWELQLGMERGVNPSGMTWTVDSVTGQINAAADNGAGNATIDIQKVRWAA